MHLYFITRGERRDVEQFISELNAKYLPFKWRQKLPDGKIIPFPEGSVIQVGVKPVQLWDITFPKEHADLVLNSVLGGEHTNVDGEVLKGGEANIPWHRKISWIIRKALGKSVLPIPDYKTIDRMPMRRQNMDVVGIGIKEDRVEDGYEML